MLLAAGCGPDQSTAPSPAAPTSAVPSVAPPTVPPPTTAPPSSPSPSPVVASANPSASQADGLPAFGHVWVIVMENTGYDQIVDSPKAPFLNELIATGGLAEAYTGIGRPSQPNYLALFSGSTHGVDDNDRHDIDAPNLADQLEAAGRTWDEYAENVRPGCFKGAEASGGRDGKGTYARKHAPAISFTSISSDPVRCANIHDLTAFEPGAVDYALIVPNLCHDMHDCSIAKGDAWLADFVPRITDSPAFGVDGLLVVTFDEGEPSDPGGGRIATILASPFVAAGTRSTVPHDHYSLLRTIQDAWGLDCLGESCTANTLVELFAGS